MTILSVDAGTSVAKCVAYDDAGAELAVERVPTTAEKGPGGRVEQDMEGVWGSVATAMRRAREAAGGRVALVTVTGQGDGAWLVDLGGRPTGPALLWSDGRANEIVERWRQDGALARAFRTTGCATFPGLPHALLAWLAAHEPQRVEASAFVLSCDGWLFHRLTGEIASDLSDASNPFLDATTRTYALDLLEELGLGWIERLLPPLVDDEHRLSALTPSAAADLGLPAGIPVVLAPYDVVSSGLGAGMSMGNVAAAILGTTLCVSAIVEVPALDGPPVGLHLSGGVGERWTRALPTLSGVEVLEWLAGLVGRPDAPAITELAAASPPGARELAFLPHLAAGGERAPFVDPGACGVLAGLRLEHEAADIARAVLEGLTATVADCVDLLPARPDGLVLAGGGSRSDLWCQLLADLTGVVVRRTSSAEPGAFGALLVALTARGDFRTTAEAAAALIRFDARFEPGADRSPYEALRARQHALRASAQEAGWWRQPRGWVAPRS
ncbi:MAG TPA: FGGY family carbohydrate kinase [Acidimicrobiales bacterium]|nr:FGGY family carbohydrate kinase [Acidimicrobiales bacterium]